MTTLLKTNTTVVDLVLLVREKQITIDFLLQTIDRYDDIREYTPLTSRSESFYQDMHTALEILMK